MFPAYTGTALLAMTTFILLLWACAEGILDFSGQKVKMDFCFRRNDSEMGNNREMRLFPGADGGV